MADAAPPYRKTFDENIAILLGELELAAKWDRPSILLAVHKSRFGQDKAEKALEDGLRKSGQTVARIVVNKERSDIPHLASEQSAGRPVFFISNLDWGGGPDGRDAYRALNIYRELFVENKIKAVFWLTQNEASSLARYAPDFWAFRHRVVEFISQRAPREVRLATGVLLWDLPSPIDPFDTLEARITVRQELLAKLPHNAEALSTRVDLLYNLGYLYWSLADDEKATQCLNEALDLAADSLAARLRSMLLNGLAILAYEAGRLEQASEFYRRALKDDPENAPLLMNWSATCCALGRNREAIGLGKKAVRVGDRDARIWNGLGYIYAAMGKFDEAIPFFARAAELAPRAAAYRISLAVAYALVERLDESRRHLEATRKLINDTGVVYLEIDQAAILGDPQEALDRMTAAVKEKRLSKRELSRDPNLNLLLDPAQIEAIR